MQHIEFFDKHHFDRYYHRAPAPAGLSHFIDFFWETNFDSLWKKYPKGFSDVLFPNTGYTYLINLGTPFIMQVGERKFDMKTDGFLPRSQSIECFHRPGNRLFGIKFRTSPILFEKKVNFAEYREHIFPLSYLMEPSLREKVRKANSFSDRVRITSRHYQAILDKHSHSLLSVKLVTEIMDDCNRKKDFTTTIESFARQYKVSTRTLQRYFEITTSISGKKALQIMRIRKAVEQLVESTAGFHYSSYGYYDLSHFYKHLKQFLHKRSLRRLRSHIKLLESVNNRKKSA